MTHLLFFQPLPENPNSRRRSGVLAHTVLALVALAMATGCGDNDTSQTQPPIVSAELQCRGDRLFPRPLSGPGMDDEGQFVGPLKDTYRVHTTQIIVRKNDTGAFLEMTGKVSAELENSPGLVAFSLSFDPDCRSYGTLGIWETDQAMADFVLSDVHLEAMDRAGEYTDFARVKSWTVSAETAQTFGWKEADAGLKDVPDSKNY